MSDNYRNESRKDWRRTAFENPTVEDLQLGCMQRIADATELMAKDYARLVREREQYERWYREQRDQNARLGRVISALRGVITRMKRKP